MAPRTVARSTPRVVEKPISVNGIVQKAMQFLILRHELAQVEKRVEDLKKGLKSYIEANPSYEDEKGNKFFTLPKQIEIGGQVFGVLKNERRVSTSLDYGKAQTVLESKGVFDEAQVFTVTLPKEVVDDLLAKKLVDEKDVEASISQDEIYRLLAEGALTEDDVDSMFATKVSWAFKPIAE